MPSDSAVRTFITGAFRSVWALDLAAILHDHPERAFSRAELVEMMRASDLVIDQSIDTLTAAGLILPVSGEDVRLHGGDAERQQLLSASLDLYRRSPDKVRRLIVLHTVPGLTAFADAFRLRGID